MSEEPVRIGYDVTLDDAVAFSMYHFYHAPGMRRRRGIAVGFLGLWILLCNVQAYGSANLGIALLYTFYYFVGALALIFSLRWAIGDRLVRRLYTADKNRGLIGAHELELTDEGLVRRTAYSEIKMAWGMIERVESTREYTFIYVGTRNAMVIPHRSITRGDYSVFMRELGQRFKPDQPLLRSGMSA